MNEGQGNGDTEVLSIRVDEDGKPVDKYLISVYPKRYALWICQDDGLTNTSKLDNSGKWLVWCATQYGHEHDLYDYELFIWNISQDKEKDWVRLTFHTGNDRWPDIFTGK